MNSGSSGTTAIDGSVVALPAELAHIEVAPAKNGKEKLLRVTLKGVARFDRKRRTTEYKAADSGYVSAWYIDEDYDGDRFVDCLYYRYYLRTVVGGKYLCVVVKVLEADAFVLTAYLTDRIKRGVTLWPTNTNA
jgi:hypothetical protein